MAARREQQFGVVVLGVAEHVELVAHLHHLAAPHHHDLGAERGDRLEVVRDEHQGHAAIAADAVDKVDDLALRDEIEGGCRLVADEQIGFSCERHGDHHALPLPAGKLVRIAGRVPRLEPDFHEQALDIGARITLRLAGEVHRLGYLRACLLERIE